MGARVFGVLHQGRPRGRFRGGNAAFAMALFCAVKLAAFYNNRRYDL
ncbi:MAG: hypothetical protein ACR2P5_09725 [Gammaproteobacteria bacterium]